MPDIGKEACKADACDAGCEPPRRCRFALSRQIRDPYRCLRTYHVTGSVIQHSVKQPVPDVAVAAEFALSDCWEFGRSGVEELTDIGGTGSRGLEGEQGTDFGVAAEAAAPRMAMKLASVMQPTLGGKLEAAAELNWSIDWSGQPRFHQGPGSNSHVAPAIMRQSGSD